MNNSYPNRRINIFPPEQHLSHDSAEHKHNSAKEELAHDLGYKSARHMMEQTEIVALPTGSYMHLTIDSDGFWVAWNDKPNYDLQRFNSRLHALTSIREDAESIVLQS